MRAQPGREVGPSVVEVGQAGVGEQQDVFCESFRVKPSRAPGTLASAVSLAELFQFVVKALEPESLGFAVELEESFGALLGGKQSVCTEPVAFAKQGLQPHGHFLQGLLTIVFVSVSRLR